MSKIIEEGTTCLRKLSSERKTYAKLKNADAFNTELHSRKIMYQEDQ